MPVVSARSATRSELCSVSAAWVSGTRTMRALPSAVVSTAASNSPAPCAVCARVPVTSRSGTAELASAARVSGDLAMHLG